jgi:general secretion pathway protein A
MYLRYFGLDEAPFSITPDPAFVFLSPRHRDALAHLLYGVGQGGSGGFVQLTGEVGTGKTTLCRCLLEQIPEGTRIALLLNPLVTPREMLAAISEELGIDTGESRDSTRLLVDGLNRFLLEAHGRGERVVVVIDEAQNLSPEALEQVRLLTNLETSKEKLLQIVLLGQPELRELLQRRNLRQLAQRITARYHLSPLGPKDTHLYVQHRMQIAGAERNPFRRSAMSALYQRSQGIPRLINIIADRALVAAYAKERLDVTAALVHDAANEVQLGERQVRRARWPWYAAGLAAVVVVAVLLSQYGPALNAERNPFSPTLSGTLPEVAAQEGPQVKREDDLLAEPGGGAEASQSVETAYADTMPVETADTASAGLPPPDVASLAALDQQWLDSHQDDVWLGMAELWSQPGAAYAIQAACGGDSGAGYVCLQNEGNWSRIKRLDLPVVLVLHGQKPAYLLLQGMDNERLRVGRSEGLITVSRDSVESRWFGAYLVAWPQAPGWPAFIGRGDSGPAVDTVMEMASRVDDPYLGAAVFDAAFELWLKAFQSRNGLEPDGIIGRNTLLHLMTASIDEPRLLQAWD